MILGRILLFRRQFDLAAQLLDRSLTLNANDADSLVQIASSMAFLGDAKRGERLFLKSLQLNPCRESWYYTYGAWPYMIQRQYDMFLETALKGPLTEVWVDQPAYYMINCAHPAHFQQTLATDEPWVSRIRAVRANASAKSHAELDETDELDDGNPNEWGEQIARLQRFRPHLTILGGCCGTDHRHVSAICRSVTVN